MSHRERLDALEEKLARLELDLQELDASLRGQMAAHDRLAARVERVERRLHRLAGDGAEAADDDAGVAPGGD